MSGSFPLAPDVDEEEVVEGERFAVSRLTGSVYRVTRWIDGPEDGQLRSLSKEELSEEEIEELPSEVRSWVEEELAEVESA